MKMIPTQLVFDPNVNDSLEKLNAIVCSCDESLLSRDGYRRMAKVFQKYKIEQRKTAISKEMTKLMSLRLMKMMRTFRLILYLF